jgi:hypothetical protein
MVAIGEARELLTAHDWRDSVEMLPDGRIRVAALDRLGGVTPKMINWWFGRMDEVTYFRFHPVDHKAFAWLRGKEPGQHVGATHLTHHCYGGLPPVLPSEITFIPPEEMFGGQPGDGTAIISAIAHALDAGGTPHQAESARFTHVALRRGYGTELRSCWWLNVTPETDLDLVTGRRLRHVHEEFAYLTSFLPALFVREQDEEES